MKKSTKIMLAVTGGILAVCVIIVAAVSIGRNKENGENNYPVITVTDAAGQAVTDVSGNAVTEVLTQIDETENAQTTQPPTLSQQLIGSWRDSANMSGYEFHEDGSVDITYVNLTVPVVNFPINGTAKGTYTLVGDELTVKSSIYSKTITKTFTASVQLNTLTLKNNEDGDVSTYERVTDTSDVTTQAPSAIPAVEENGLIGTWVDSDGSTEYTFKEDGTVAVVFSNVKFEELANTLSGVFNGVYIADGDKLTVQFVADSQKITKEYTYSVSGNSMSFKSGRDTVLFVRKNASLSVSGDEAALIGKWTDSSEMSGYEFKAEGIVDITYVNFTVPVINMPINGTYSGTYSISGNKLTISASIYGKTVQNEYTYVVSGNTLTLTSTDDGNISTYSKK